MAEASRKLGDRPMAVGVSPSLSSTSHTCIPNNDAATKNIHEPSNIILLPLLAAEVAVDAAFCALYGAAVAMSTSSTAVQVTVGPPGGLVRLPLIVLSGLVPVQEGRLSADRVLFPAGGANPYFDSQVLALYAPTQEANLPSKRWSLLIASERETEFASVWGQYA